MKCIPQNDPPSQQDAQKFLKSAPAGSSPQAGEPSCEFSKEEIVSFLNNFALPLFLSGTMIQELKEMVNHSLVVWDAARGLEHYLITLWVWKNFLLSQNVPFLAGFYRSGELLQSRHRSVY